jgi:hypothetical protein
MNSSTGKKPARSRGCRKSYGTRSALEKLPAGTLTASWPKSSPDTDCGMPLCVGQVRDAGQRKLSSPAKPQRIEPSDLLLPKAGTDHSVDKYYYPLIPESCRSISPNPYLPGDGNLCVTCSKLFQNASGKPISVHGFFDPGENAARKSVPARARPSGTALLPPEIKRPPGIPAGVRGTADGAFRRRKLSPLCVSLWAAAPRFR